MFSAKHDSLLKRLSSRNLEENKSNKSENIKANKLNKIILEITKHIVETSASPHEGLTTIGIAESK